MTTSFHSSSPRKRHLQRTSTYTAQPFSSDDLRRNTTSPQQTSTTTSPSEVFVVLEGHKVVGVYQWVEDARQHAQAVGGTYITQQIKWSVPVWVETMNNDKLEKAKLQTQASYRRR